MKHRNFIMIGHTIWKTLGLVVIGFFVQIRVFLTAIVHSVENTVC